MIVIEIPGRGVYTFENLVLDMNGTIAVDGEISDSVFERIERLSELLKVHIVTADTHGRLEAQKDRLAAAVYKIAPPNEVGQKADFLGRLGGSNCIAIGNGSNDAEMLRQAGLAIAVMGEEGCSAAVLTVADLVTKSAESALDLILKPNRLIATLRK